MIPVGSEDEILQNAVLRQLSVVGEAASCLSDEMRGRLSDIPWREVRGFRNVAVHAYFSLDWDVVHEVATVNLPSMATQVLAVLQTEDPEIAANFGTKKDGAPGSDADSAPDGVATP